MIVAAILLAAATADPISGTWEGTSLCEVKPSPCHDEHVVYRIHRKVTRQYRIDAYKIIGGKQLFMGAIQVTFDPDRSELEGTIAGVRGSAQVRFTLKGQQLSGQMMLDGTLYRVIEVDKR
jgi:hypothetical protein